MDKKTLLDSIFTKAKDLEAPSTFDQTKTMFLSTVGVTTPIVLPKEKGLLHGGLITGIITSIAGIAILISIQFINKENDSEHKNNVEPEAINFLALPNPKEDSVMAKIELEFSREPDVEIGKLPLLANEFVDWENYTSRVEMPLITELPAYTDNDPKKIYQKQPYRFPVLTPEEKRENNKKKKQLIRTCHPNKKSGMIYIPSGTFEYQHKKVSVKSFKMAQMEITNQNYRIFLFDLLIQGRKEDFLKAKPHQNQWVKIAGESMQPMANQYFSHEIYNWYPVVNVSTEGAEMYCAWLTHNMRNEYPKETFNDFRLPSNVEWVFAATNGGKNLTYPWGGNKVTNEAGCFLANFNSKGYDKLNQINQCRNFNYERLPQFVEFDASDGGLITVKVISYNPNPWGLYNFSGNVTEMVKMEDGTYGTMGGGWMSTAEEIKLSAPVKDKGNVKAHPNNGFRIVITPTQE